MHNFNLLFAYNPTLTFFTFFSPPQFGVKGKNPPNFSIDLLRQTEGLSAIEHAQTRLYTHTYTRAHLSARTRIHVQAHAHAHAYAHAHTHTCMYTDAHISIRKQQPGVKEEISDNGGKRKEADNVKLIFRDYICVGRTD